LAAAAATDQAQFWVSSPKREIKIAAGGRAHARRLEAMRYRLASIKHQRLEAVTGLADAGEALMMPLIAATTPPAIARAKTTESRTFFMARSPDRSWCGR
jgi:hypothetical protein